MEILGYFYEILFAVINSILEHNTKACYFVYDKTVCPNQHI